MATELGSCEVPVWCRVWSSGYMQGEPSQALGPSNKCYNLYSSARADTAGSYQVLFDLRAKGRCRPTLHTLGRLKSQKGSKLVVREPGFQILFCPLKLFNMAILLHLWITVPNNIMALLAQSQAFKHRQHQPSPSALYIFDAKVVSETPFWSCSALGTNAESFKARPIGSKWNPEWMCITWHWQGHAKDSNASES